MVKTLRKLDTCPNCDQPLSGAINFCAECGQENTTKNVSFGLLVRDILDDYFTLDSRFFSSMKPFLTKPGLLTNEFNTGRRKKFMPPLRMYIVFSLVYFIIPQTNDPAPDGKDNGSSNVALAETEIVMPPLPDSGAVAGSSQFSFDTDTLGNQQMNITIGDADMERFRNDPVYADSVINGTMDKWELKEGSFGRKIAKNVWQNIMSMFADDGKHFMTRVYDNIPTMMFFLLPIFALLIKLFHFRKKPLYVETVIFSLHFHSFVFLVFALNSTFRLIGVFDDLFEVIMLILVAVYLVKSLHTVYNQSYWKTILKSVALSFTYSIFVALAVAFTFAFTLYSY